MSVNNKHVCEHNDNNYYLFFIFLFFFTLLVVCINISYSFIDIQLCQNITNIMHATRAKQDFDKFELT